jgi:hypothetical protein
MLINFGASSGGGSEVYMTKAILSSTNWDTATMTQTATINGLEADETKQAIYISPVINESIINEITNCNVYASNQINNGIVFKCETIPNIDIEFYVKWQNITWVKPVMPPPNLIDFEYDYDEANDTYILTSWKETTNGVASTEIIIPNDERIII